MNKKYVDKIEEIKLLIKEIEDKLCHEENSDKILCLKKQLREFTIILSNSK